MEGLLRDMDSQIINRGIALRTFLSCWNKGVKRNNKWEDEGHFFNCTCFGKTAENLATYMTKGQQVSIVGSLTQNRWTTEDGQNRSNVEVTVNAVQLIGGRKDDAVRPSQGPPPRQPLANTPENFIGDNLDYDDPLPF